MAEHDQTQGLARSAKQGSRRAFDTLCERFRDRLRSSIEGWIRFRVGPAVDIDQIVQDTFVRAFQSLARFQWQGDDSFHRWLCGIAKRALAQAMQDARAVRGSAPLSDVTAGGVSPSTAMQRQERFNRLEQSLEKLNPDYRRVLLLSRIEGLPLKEIAQRMDRSPNAVKHLVARALRELREHFTDTESLSLPDRELGLEDGSDGDS
jgi:RNA polymerase sigma-70 factor (ECF subfamily)